ncbi:MAG: nucleotide exchange factor GrpE [Rikenellaceae bacterium]
MTEEKVYNQEVNVDEGFVEGDGYPSCGGSPCDNMAEEEVGEEAATDTVADDEPTQEPAQEAAAEAAKEEETSDWRDKYLRLQAEFDNYRKRTLREKMDLVQSGGADTVKAFLPVIDDIDRAVVAMAKSEDVVALRQGVDLIAAKFGEILKQRGVVEIEAMGLELDTDHHEAIARFPAEEAQKGKIIDVVQKGYMLSDSDKVLRFAKVVVGE